MRGVTVSGKLHRGIRYIDRVIEEASAIVRAMQENGDNVTRLVQLIDMRQFNFVQHGCPVCKHFKFILFSGFIIFNILFLVCVGVL